MPVAHPAALSLPSSAGWGRKHNGKNWVEIRTGRWLYKQTKTTFLPALFFPGSTSMCKACDMLTDLRA